MSPVTTTPICSNASKHHQTQAKPTTNRLTTSGDTYLRLLAAAKAGAPDIHVHAFSPLEVATGAAARRQTVSSYLAELRSAGLGSLPGTAAEVLDDDVRAIICPDKLNSAQWLEARARMFVQCVSYVSCAVCMCRMCRVLCVCAWSTGVRLGCMCFMHLMHERKQKHK